MSEYLYLADYYKSLKSRKFKIAVLNGVFAIVHSGHISLIRFARKLVGVEGDVTVLINSDESVKRIKGDNKVIVDQESRRLVLCNIKDVDNVHIFEEDSPVEILKQIRPDFLVKGKDYNGKLILGAEYADAICLGPYDESISTTKIFDKIVEKNNK